MRALVRASTWAERSRLAPGSWLGRVLHRGVGGGRPWDGEHTRSSSTIVRGIAPGLIGTHTYILTRLPIAVRPWSTARVIGLKNDMFQRARSTNAAKSITSTARSAAANRVRPRSRPDFEKAPDKHHFAHMVRIVIGNQ